MSPPRRINEIIHRQRAISADTALRLGKYFGNSPQFWMNLQTWYDLEFEKDKNLEKIDREVHSYKKRLKKWEEFKFKNSRPGTGDGWPL
jgi:plasmid maintenance system antidote protein VapI